MSNVIWANAQEAADHTGLSVHTIRVYTARKKIPFYKVGRLTKYRLTDLDEWLESKKVPAQTTAHTDAQ